MDKNKLEVNNNDFGIIKFPRNQAQADYKISKKKIIRKDGTVFYKKTTTTNDEKISDACIQIFQQSNLAKDFDLMPYITVEENVGKFLSNMFKEEKRARVQELLAMVEMTEFAKVKAK